MDFDYILSFDIGYKNLAYCIMTSDGRILEWENLTLYTSDKLTEEEKTQCLINKLKSIGILTNAKYVILIEKQFKNPIIISISQQILMYYMMVKNKQVLFSHYDIMRIVKYSPSHKLKYYDTLSLPKIEQKVLKSKYSMNKQLAIKQIDIIFHNNEELYRLYGFPRQYPCMIVKYCSAEKRDDLADCALQGWSYLSKMAPKNNTL